MKKLDLTNVNEAGDTNNRRTPPAGGYVVTIWTVVDNPERERLEMTYDIAEGDYKNYGANMMEQYGFNPLKLFKSYKPNALPFFKRFLSAVTKSNPGFVWADDENALINKKVGLVLGEEQYRKSNGDIGVRLYVDREIPVAKVKAGDFPVPELKKLPGTHPAAASALRPVQLSDKELEDLF